VNGFGLAVNVPDPIYTFLRVQLVEGYKVKVVVGV
jgi:hypothetical protein